MKKIYRFSPIKTEKQLYTAVDYIATKTTDLCKKITGKEYPIGYLTIFSHYFNEFTDLEKMLKNLGTIIGDNNGPFVKLHKPIRLPHNQLHKLRVRKPDPYRLHVGCNDFDVPDYTAFKTKYIQRDATNLRLIKRPDYEMIEFFDPEYDVLAYIVSSALA